MAAVHDIAPVHARKLAGEQLEDVGEQQLDRDGAADEMDDRPLGACLGIDDPGGAYEGRAPLDGQRDALLVALVPNPARAEDVLDVAVGLAAHPDGEGGVAVERPPLVRGVDEVGLQAPP